MPANVRLYLQGERADKVLLRKASRDADRVRTAARGAAQDALDFALTRARVDLKSQGRLGAKYVDSLQGKITEGGGNIRVSITNDEPGFDFFQTGGTIKGKPLMWIPVDNSGISAKDYAGRLVNVKRKNGGTPILLDTNSRTVKYVGVTEVNVPKRFNTAEIVEQAAGKLQGFYRTRFASLPVE